MGLFRCLAASAHVCDWHVWDGVRGLLSGMARPAAIDASWNDWMCDRYCMATLQHPQPYCYIRTGHCWTARRSAATLCDFRYRGNWPVSRVTLNDGVLENNLRVKTCGLGLETVWPWPWRQLAFLGLGLDLWWRFGFYSLVINVLCAMSLWYL